MKINKYINAFIATAIMAAGAVSCTNDDTVDDKNLYVISLQTTGLTAEQQKDFESVVKAQTFGVDVTEAYQKTYGLYSSEAYARARYDELVSGSALTDSIINIYADKYNVVDFGVNVVLMQDSTNVLSTSETFRPTVQRQNYTLSIAQTDGSLDATGIAALAKYTKDIYGIAPNTSTQVQCTPGYVSTYYLNTLSSDLADSITTLVPSKGAANIYEDFSEKVTLAQETSTVGTTTVEPYSYYVMWYEVKRGATLSQADSTTLYDNIKTLTMFGGLDNYPWSKADKVNRSKAIVNYTNLMLTNNNAIQTMIDAFAAEKDNKDFEVDFHLSVADGNTQPIKHDWLTFAEQNKKYVSTITKQNYKFVYELTAGSLGKDTTKVMAVLNSIMDAATPGKVRVLTPAMYVQTAKAQFETFKSEATAYSKPGSTATYTVSEIADYLANLTGKLDFSITFKLVENKTDGTTVDKFTSKPSFTVSK